jgi:predicted permease
VFALDGQPLPPPENQVAASQNWIAGDYLGTLRIPLRAGRDFGPADDQPGAPPVALVSESFVRRNFPGGDALGHRVRVGAKQDEPWRTVVGVVGDVRQNDVRAEPPQMIYLPNAQQTERSMGIVVRSALPPEALAASVRRELRALDPDQPLSDLKSLPALLSEQRVGYAYGAGLMLVFAALALLLGAGGIGAVAAYSVQLRSRELGIRLALGATPSGVVRLCLRDGMRPALAGLVIGLLGAAAVTRTMEALLHEVKPLDPATFAGAALFLASVATAACWLPARRAAAADPLDSLKAE